MTSSAYDHYRAAIDARDRILSGASNERPVQAWATVARLCAIASEAFWAEQGSRVHGRSQQSFLSNLDKVCWAARAQVETLGASA